MSGRCLSENVEKITAWSLNLNLAGISASSQPEIWHGPVLPGLGAPWNASSLLVCCAATQIFRLVFIFQIQKLTKCFNCLDSSIVSKLQWPTLGNPRQSRLINIALINLNQLLPNNCIPDSIFTILFIMASVEGELSKTRQSELIMQCHQTLSRSSGEKDQLSSLCAGNYWIWLISVSQPMLDNSSSTTRVTDLRPNKLNQQTDTEKQIFI